MHADLIPASSPLFDSLSPWETEEIGKRLIVQRWEAGKMIFRQGDIGDRLFIVRSGLVEILAAGEDGKPELLARLGRGDCFGEMSLLTGERRSADALAASAVELFVLQQSDFLRAMTTCPALSRNIGRILSERLQRSTELMLRRRKVGDLTVIGGLPGLAEAGILAFNVAVSLSRQSRKKVIILLAPTDKIGRAAAAGVPLLPSLADVYERRELLEQHQRTGGNPPLAGLNIALLSAEGVPELDAVGVVTALDWFRGVYDHVVVATGLGPEPALRELLRHADRVLILCPAKAEATEAVKSWGLSPVLGGPDKTSLVIVGGGETRRADKETGDATGWPVRRRLPLAHDLLAASSAGLPFVLSQPDAALTRGVDWLARDIGRLKVGIALGAGGAKGHAHLGALRVLAEAGVPFDFLSGTSIGAVISSWLATGLSVAETAHTLTDSFNPETVKKLFALSLSGFSVGGNLELAMLLQRTIGERHFADLAIPLVVVAVDLRSRQEIALREGLVREAVHASMSIPGTFPPFPMNDRLLVDGVTLNPVPAEPVRALGADIVIGINLISRSQLPAWPGESPRAEAQQTSKTPQMLDSLFQVMDIMQTETSERCAGQADLVITPVFGPCSWRDFHRAPQFVAAGEHAANEARSALRQLLPWIG